MDTGLPAIINSGVLSLALDPRAPSTLHATIENAGVYRTTDGARGRSRSPRARSV